jgi:hypothetical protein
VNVVAERTPVLPLRQMQGGATSKVNLKGSSEDISSGKIEALIGCERLTVKKLSSPENSKWNVSR